MGYNCNCPLHERETLLDYVNNWTKIAGNHTVRFGGTFERRGISGCQAINIVPVYTNSPTPLRETPVFLAAGLVWRHSC